MDETSTRGEGGDGNRAARRRGPRGPRRRLGRILRWASAVLALLILGSGGAAYAYYQHLDHNLRKGARTLAAKPSKVVRKPKANKAGKTPVNILVIGSDGRNSKEDLKLGGAHDSVGSARADVIMIVHLSADRRHMSVVSIPRDTRVRIPACTDPKTGKKYPASEDIINASLGHGGAGCVLATVQDLTHVYLDHWMMIDFAGVVKMADAVGGVDVCVRQNVWDHPTAAQPGGSHLKLTAGTHTIKGVQALQWLRTRHAWGSDRGRADAQHMYLSALMRKLTSQNVFTHPGRMMSLAETATSSLQVSEEIGSVKKLYDLGMELKEVPPDRTTMLTMPTLQDPQDPEAHYVENTKDASVIWEMLRDDIPMDTADRATTSASPSPGDAGAASPSSSPSASPDPAGSGADAPSDVPVTVVNGTAGTATGQPVKDRGTELAQRLVADGWTRAAADPAARPAAHTGVSYPTSGGATAKADALAVAKDLGVPAAQVTASATVQKLTLTVGADWKSGTDYASTLPRPGALPKSASAVNGADKGTCMNVYGPYQW
jgi:LCP family protein required for cell wall assembly